MAEDAIAKARAIAARLGAVAGSGSIGGSAASELGKRKNRWDDDSGNGGGHHGLGALTKQKVYVPVREYPEYNWIGLLIGPRGKTQKELEQRTGAKILFRGRGSSKDNVPTGHPDDDDELHVAVEGPSDAVEKAILELEDIFKNPAKADQLKQQQLRNLADMNSTSGGSQQSSIYGPGSGGSVSGATGPIGEIRNEGGEFVVDLEVPNNLVGFIIGRGGENIVKMQTQTGGHIQIAKESEMKPGETMRRVTIRGSEGAVKELKYRIEETVANKTGRSMSSGPKEQKELETAFVLKVVIPNDKVGLIIGKGGVTVKMIQDKTFSQVQIPPNPDEDNPAVRTLSIGAETREAVEACQLEIFNTLQQQQQQQLMGVSAYQPPAAFTMIIPDDRVGVVIGKRGATISDLQNRHGVRIQIPQYADVGSMPPVRTVSITGGNGNELLVKAEIEALINNAAPGNQHHSYYGASDSTGGYYQAQSYYGQQYAYDAYGYAATDASAQQAAAQDPATIDPTAYYPDFWNYASLYGEEAARLYYTTWSPPVGTEPPPGITLPTSMPVPTTDATTTAVAAGQPATEQSPEAIAAAWEQYNRQYAEWMAQQAGGVAVPTTEPSAEQPPPPST